MSDTTKMDTATELQNTVEQVLSVIEQEREREIITRRFGLYDRKETLEQIGELLGITRERVRQLEKAILSRLRSAVQDNKAPQALSLEKDIILKLSEAGRIARLDQLTTSLLDTQANDRQKAHVGFIAELAPNLTVINENDDFHNAVGIAKYGSEKDYKANITTIVKAIKAHGEPTTAQALYQTLNFEHPQNVLALATISKKLAHLKDRWGLAKWPTVNPKNIRDKIFVILEDSGKPMHFSDIAKEIKDSSFKRRDVTTQAIHNELIKDKRFVLIGRGIYALDTWGFTQGTVADIITDVLKKAGEPLHRDEIVKRVLKSRQVKETTILLNLQNKPQFQRVSKATYGIADTADQK